MDIDALIQKGRSRLSEQIDIPNLFGDGTNPGPTLRFGVLDGGAWRALIRKHPVTDAESRLSGYDMDAVAREFPGMTLVDGEDADDLHRTVDGESVYQWPALFDSLSAPAMELIGVRLQAAHEMGPLQRILAAGKASKGGQRKKRSSPANSASQSGN